MYMQVESHSNTRLHLKRSPGIRSWSILVGISSFGIAAAYYSEDSLGWKLFYLVGCLFVAAQNLEEWEEAIFEKDAGKVYLKSFSLYKKLLTFSRAGHEQGKATIVSYDVETVANLIIGFLELNELQIDEGLETSSGTDVSDEDQAKDK
ncbi:putative protein C17orf62, partial [Ophiophagus hannah]